MQRIELSGDQVIERVENVVRIARVASLSGEPVELDMARLGRFQIGAAARLGNCLRDVASRTKLTIALPTDLRELAASGIAHQIAAHASQLKQDGRVGTRRLRAELRLAIPTYAHVDVLHDIHTHSLFVPRDRGVVLEYVKRWRDGFPTAQGRLPSDESLSSLVEIIVEASDNVQDHSAKMPLDRAASVASYMRLRWWRSAEVTVVPEGFPGEDQSSGYLARMIATSRRGGVGGFLELTVADDGVGVAARFALDNEIVLDRNEAPERAAFAAALESGGTVKLRAQDCPVEKTPGFGSEIVGRTVQALRGFVSIRSGRLQAFLDGTRDSEVAEFSVESTTRAALSGCVVSVLVPVFAEPERFDERRLTLW